MGDVFELISDPRFFDRRFEQIMRVIRIIPGNTIRTLSLSIIARTYLA